MDEGPGLTEDKRQGRGERRNRFGDVLLNDSG